MKVLKTFVATLVLFLGSVFCLSAQTRVVSGQVLDAQQQPVIGAAVLSSGTGEVTDIDGNFVLSVPAGDVEIEVSCLGYVTKKVNVPAVQSKITIVLDEDNMMIEETVVVGYGTQKKVNLTGAVSVVDDKQLQDRTSHNLSTMLQGSVPGLNITTTTGNPGSTGTLNIRGFTSINEAEPIVLIDGAIGELEDVNPNDVASISVIKDASAAAVYGARGTYGVILVTTKKGSSDDGKAKIRYSGRFGWEEPTTSTDYESRGYWSVYTLDLFWKTQAAGTPYTNYTQQDMLELLARVNDKTENPERPWVVEEVRNGRKQWIYYANTDWYHELFRDRHPVQQHNVSITGGTKAVKYFVSAGYDRQTGILKMTPDVFQKLNLRAKIDADLKKWLKLSNNTSFYNSQYSYIGVGNDQDVFQNLRHSPASFPLFNPDGSGIYNTPLITGYNVANGRQIVYAMGKHQNEEKKFNFANTTQLTITPVKQVNIVGDFTYKRTQRADMHRWVNIPYSITPDESSAYVTGAGQDRLQERTRAYNYLSGNVFATYEDTFKNAHNLKIMAGFNAETYDYKNVLAQEDYLSDELLNDLNLKTGETVSYTEGGKSEYAIMGFFGRINYDYKGRYLFELAGRYDGSSRFAPGHRWVFCPSGSAGWRISEEPFFAPAKKVVDNLKLRASVGSLANQNVTNYAYMRTISVSQFSGFTFGETATRPSYSGISAPNAGDLTWETSYQYNIGLDAAFFSNRLEFTAEAYIRDTKDMLTNGAALPSVYGASSPLVNNADLRTRGYELSLGWRDSFKLAGHDFGYSVRATLSDYDSYITRYANNPDKKLVDYYEGMRIGEIWGYEVDGLFQTDEEAKYYQENVCDALTLIGTNRMQGGFLAGDLRYVDLDNKHEGENGINMITMGKNTAEDPGDRRIIGNSLPSMQYGFNLSFDWMGFDVSAFFQGVGNHYYYPPGMSIAFWGSYSYAYYTAFMPTDFIKTVWSEDNKDAYFPRARAYSSTGGELAPVNTRYLQNVRYLRFKNLTVGYTLPQRWTKAIHIDKVRVYFSGENLAYWSPIKKYTKYLDPESAYRRDLNKTTTGTYKNSDAKDAVAYPWQKTMMFGIDITF
ncbi:MAG: TonB-dependent receptor [Clostridium sp.]|nr:TonB-dependent receptor [Bacteroides sp.]MCM1198540.1 TonB-dependent receptor [Clostridium sp.]